jgi:hypothetical protein
MKRIVLMLLFLTAAMPGCKDSNTTRGDGASHPSASTAATPSGESHKLIERYNRLLSEGYKTTNMTLLKEVATPELAEKAYYHMAAIGEAKSRMVSELKKIDFAETDCSQPLKCRVVTREKWDFAYADIQTGKRYNEVKDYIYDVQYLVENRQGHWLITEINATGEDRKEVPAWRNMFKKQ